MIGVLIVAHGTLGESLIHCASHVLGRRPMRVRQLGITIHDDPDTLLPQAQDLIAHLDDGSGVLVLTDLYGATPANLVARLLVPGRIEALAGVNLPMLIRALTYRERSLGEVLEKAASGGRDGVMQVPALGQAQGGADHAAA